MSDTENEEVKDKSESDKPTENTGHQTKPKLPPLRGKTFGGTGAEKRG